MRLNKNSAENSGKQCRKSPVTSWRLQGAERSVSSRASGMLTTTREAAAAMAMATAATLTERVTSSATENATITATERSAWLMPAKSSLSACCRRPWSTSARPSMTL